MVTTTPQPVEYSVSGTKIFEGPMAPGFGMKMGKWDFAKLCYVRCGRGLLARPGQSTPIAADQVLYLPAGAEHRFADDPDEPLALIMAGFDPAALAALPGVDTVLADFATDFPVMTPFRLGRTHRYRAIVANFSRMAFEQTAGGTGSAAVISALLVDTIVLLARSAAEIAAHGTLSDRNEAFAETLDFLDECFADPIHIKDLAAMAGLSYRRYTARFKQARGETVNAYLTRKRLDFAKKRLAKTGDVAASAHEAGFGDLSHFYRVFKQATGETPRQFIREQAEPGFDFGTRH